MLLEFDEFGILKRRYNNHTFDPLNGVSIAKQVSIYGTFTRGLVHEPLTCSPETVDKKTRMTMANIIFKLLQSSGNLLKLLDIFAKRLVSCIQGQEDHVKINFLVDSIELGLIQKILQ